MRYVAFIMSGILASGLLFAGDGVPSITREEARLLEQAHVLSETNALEAAQLLADAGRRENSSAALDYAAANLWRRAGRDEAAREAFRQALEKMPTFDAARLELARTLAALEEWREAERVLRFLAGKPDASLEILTLQGYLLLAAERFVAAEWFYRRALAAYGETAPLLHGLGKTLLGQQRGVEATAVLETLVRLSPGDTTAWALLADAWLARDRPDTALVRLETARRFDAVNVPMRMLLGDLYVNHDLAEEAVVAYSEALAAEPADDGLILRAAEGLLLAGRFEQADAMLERYADLKDEPATGYYRLRTRWALSSGNPDEALATGQAWVQAEPLHKEALLTLGDLAEAADDPDTAELWYARARDAHPRSVQPLRRLARLATARRDYAAAASHLENAMMLENNPAVRQSLRHVQRMAELTGTELP